MTAGGNGSRPLPPADPVLGPDTPRAALRRWPWERWTSGRAGRPPRLGDFTMAPRVIIIAIIAAVIGVIAAFVALALLRLIGFFTNLFFYGQIGKNIVSVKDNDLGWLILVVPTVGGLVVGLMARYGSDKIRGHGIPEAIESILINGSRVQPRVAILKPVSSAIAIGTGGPFGAEGPIIMTGGALGSIIAQLFHLTAAERKTLLVAGAAGGMSATFAAPVASVLLAVELLLFEWKPRSLIPVAIASAMAAIVRHWLLGSGPIFPVPAHANFIGVSGLAGCLFVGLSGGVLSAIATQAVYASEDGFHRLPIHWMWWPAIGGLVIGIGGLFFPAALSVGYDNIGTLLAGNASMHLIIGILIVKLLIWSISLGSGTSGGVLAPLLMMGGALGALEANMLPGEGAGFWALVGMGAVLGGTMRAPLTGIVFSFELTHDPNALLPLLVAVSVSYGFTVLLMRRSILTEKISRRGYHLGCEYSVDPLELVLVREVMRTAVAALPGEATLGEVAPSLRADRSRTGQRLYPVLDGRGRLAGVVTRGHLMRMLATSTGEDQKQHLVEIADRTPVLAYTDEPLRVVAERMAETGVTRMPVVRRDDPHTMAGMVSLTDLLRARGRVMEEERRRERVIRLRVLPGGRHRGTQPAPSPARDSVSV